MNAWQKDAEERLNDLLRMPDIHNSYGCPNPGAEQTLELLYFFSRLPSEVDAPVIMPDKSGEITVSFMKPSGVLKAVARKEKFVNWGGRIITLFLGPAQEVWLEGTESRLLKEFLEAV